MRTVIQRVAEAKVTVDGKELSRINNGLLLLVGVCADDTNKDADYLVNKIINLRIFEDNDKKMNLNIKQIKGEVLSIPQVTLYANTSDGNRPGFEKAAKPDLAEEIWKVFNLQLHKQGINVREGRFGAKMQVQLVNNGPITILLDSKKYDL